MRNHRLLALSLALVSSAVAVAPTGPAVAPPTAKTPSRFKTERDARRAAKKGRR